MAAPGYYSAVLHDWNTTAEVAAAGTHSGTHRYTCHGAGLCGLVIDVCHSVDSATAKTCKNASVTVDVSTGGVVVSASLLHSGSLSGVCMHCVGVIPVGMSIESFPPHTHTTQAVAPLAA